MADPTYVDESDVAAYLKVSVVGNETELALAASGSCRWVGRYCGRRFDLAAEATARTFDVNRDGVVWVDDIGDTDDLAVATDDSQNGTFTTAWAESDYQVQPASALELGDPITSLTTVGTRSFPVAGARTGLVRVTARWGWPAVPDDVRLAALIQAARLYKRRDSAEGVLGASDFGVVRVGARVDPDAELLLASYRMPPGQG